MPPIPTSTVFLGPVQYLTRHLYSLAADRLIAGYVVSGALTGGEVFLV